MIRITETLSIHEDELRYRAARATGPGGQHVNTTSSAVTLLFDLEASPSLTPEQKELVRERLGNRISRNGVLQVTNRESRSQFRNKSLALARFVSLLREALKPKPVRKQAKIPLSVKKKRLEDKRRRGDLKRQRAKGGITGE